MKYKAYSGAEQKQRNSGFLTQFFPGQEYVTNTRPPEKVSATFILTTGDLQTVVRGYRTNRQDFKTVRWLKLIRPLITLRQEVKSWRLGEELRVLTYRPLRGLQGALFLIFSARTLIFCFILSEFLRIF
jgi:hypothetical protein